MTTVNDPLDQKTDDGVDLLRRALGFMIEFWPDAKKDDVIFRKEYEHDNNK